MKEIEVKIININLEKLKNNLLDINAIKVKEENQINNIFDFEDLRLRKIGGYARVRIVEDLMNNKTITYLTTKELVSKEKFKIMNEHEVIVSDSNNAILILKSLGLKQTQCIKKYRESYKINNSLIEIDINEKDFCPFPYIEIESPNEKELEETVKLLGYTLEDTTSENMFELIEKFKKENTTR